MILQRYIFRELLGSFIFAFCAVLSVCMVGTMFQVFRSFPGLGFVILATAMPLATATMAGWVILIAACTSGTLIYARLAAENEITAMRTCGIHTGRIVAPAFLLGLLLVGISYPLNEVVVPWARFSKKIYFRESALHVLKLPQPGSQDYRIGQVRITYTDFKDGQMVLPSFSKYSKDKLILEYFAPTGRIIADDGPPRVVMMKPRGWKLDEKTGKEERFSAENEISVDISMEEGEAKRQVVDLPSWRLWEMAFASKDPAVRNPLLLILHTRYAMSLAPLLLVLVSVPMGILVRRGSRLAGLGAALPPLLIYIVSYFVLQGLGDKNRIPPLLAAYGPDAFLGLLSSLLLWGVSRR